MPNDDWFPSYDAIRELLLAARPDLTREYVNDVMSIGDVWVALGEHALGVDVVLACQHDR